ncbi:hypothetical protein HZS_7913 [Henneguya salminicola]|nr:hypothetical protein HZS_7913 [Henneguya salminicola]
MWWEIYGSVCLQVKNKVKPRACITTRDPSIIINKAIHGINNTIQDYIPNSDTIQKPIQRNRRTNNINTPQSHTLSLL